MLANGGLDCGAVEWEAGMATRLTVAIKATKVAQHFRITLHSRNHLFGFS
jgi:hypothetical protein